MALQLTDCTFSGPALPEPFVKFQLEEKLRRASLLPKTTGPDGARLQEQWESYRRRLRDLGGVGGAVRVAGHVLEPLAPRLGYARVERSEDVETREGPEDGGQLFLSADGTAHLRVWSLPVGTDLDAPGRRGHAYRFSPSRIAQRVLQARGERVALLTDGEELRLLLSDPARPESRVTISLDRADGWRGARTVPDSYRLLVALASPGGVAKVPELVEDARLAQTTVTAKLRKQARLAIETFVQEVLDHPANEEERARWRADPAATARTLWAEGLVLVYRLLFVFKLESAADPARAFSFASTSLWRQSYSPNTALAPIVRRVLDQGADTGQFLEESLRTLFRLFEQGLTSSELKVTALGGMLFGSGTTPLLDSLAWGERAVASLLDHLLWTPGDGRTERERVHYGTLDVEDLGRVYESLLELEPGIATAPMCRLKRAKLEVVVPLAQGERYRGSEASDEDEDHEESEDGESEEDDEPRRGVTTRVQWIEEIPAGRFYLRVGLGRKASGSYYTPHAFVRFLVQETLGPQVAERSPPDDPKPAAILDLKALDPAMGSGHFLVEACRYLADKVYEACRLCDELSLEAEERAERASAGEKDRLLARAAELRSRVEALPDPNNDLVAYLPSRVIEGAESGLSQRKAEALCRRLVAVHCLYGVDKNPLAVGLAKVSLWLESYAEGLPLTFLDHRLILGDSLTGPFLEHLLTWPCAGGSISSGSELYLPGIRTELETALGQALAHVRDLEKSVGVDLGDLENKRAAKERLDRAIGEFRILAAAWSGGVLLGEHGDDVAYAHLLKKTIEGGATGMGGETGTLLAMLEAGRAGLPYDLAFPEVFHPNGMLEHAGGFDAVLGNPPWDAIQFKSKEFLAAFDLGVFEASTKHERTEVQERLLADPRIGGLFHEHSESFEQLKRSNDRLFRYQKVSVEGDLAGRQLDTFRVFMERNAELLGPSGYTGVVVPSAFHANAGATGIRQLYLERMALQCCYSFENRRKLFDIDSRFKFAAVVARASRSATESFDCAFYLHDLEWLFSDAEPLNYTLEFVRRTGGHYLNLVELRSSQDNALVRSMYESRASFVSWCSNRGISWRTTELHTTHDSRLFREASTYMASDDRNGRAFEEVLHAGALPLFEGKTFHQYDRSWARPRFVALLADLEHVLKPLLNAWGVCSLMLHGAGLLRRPRRSVEAHRAVVAA